MVLQRFILNQPLSIIIIVKTACNAYFFVIISDQRKISIVEASKLE